MTFDDTHAGLGWPTDPSSAVEAAGSTTAAGLGWPADPTPATTPSHDMESA
jgi:hypothetical protein